jgi:hypothetical protein
MVKQREIKLLRLADDCNQRLVLGVLDEYNQWRECLKPKPPANVGHRRGDRVSTAKCGDAHSCNEYAPLVPDGPVNICDGGQSGQGDGQQNASTPEHVLIEARRQLPGKWPYTGKCRVVLRGARRL